MKSLFNQALVISRDEELAKEIETFLKNHSFLNNIYSLSSPFDSLKYLNKLNSENGKIPGLIFLVCSEFDMGGEAFIEFLESHYTESSQRSVVIIDNIGSASQLLEFAIKMPVRSIISTPVLKTDLEEVIPEISHWSEASVV